MLWTIFSHWGLQGGAPPVISCYITPSNCRYIYNLQWTLVIVAINQLLSNYGAPHCTNLPSTQVTQVSSYGHLESNSKRHAKAQTCEEVLEPSPFHGLPEPAILSRAPGAHPLAFGKSSKQYCMLNVSCTWKRIKYKPWAMRIRICT